MNTTRYIDWSTVRTHADRLCVADAFDEEGRREEAETLRSKMACVIARGRVYSLHAARTGSFAILITALADIQLVKWEGGNPHWELKVNGSRRLCFGQDAPAAALSLCQDLWDTHCRKGDGILVLTEAHLLALPAEMAAKLT